MVGVDTLDDVDADDDVEIELDVDKLQTKRNIAINIIGIRKLLAKYLCKAYSRLHLALAKMGLHGTRRTSKEDFFR